MSNILHGFTDPRYLDVLIAKTEAQIREAESAEDRQRFGAYLDVLNNWKKKMHETKDTLEKPDERSNSTT